MWECENCDIVNEDIEEICAYCGATQQEIVHKEKENIIEQQMPYKVQDIKINEANTNLVQCSSCAKLFSRRAESCPKCGAKSPELTLCQICNQEIISNTSPCPHCGDPTPSMNTNSVNETYTKKKIPETETRVAEMKLNRKNRKGKIKSFFKTPLMYVFIIFGAPIGRKVGLSLDPSTPAQVGAYVAMSVIICDIFAAFTGYFISIGIDALLNQKFSRILLKLFAGVIGFLIYCVILAAIP